MVRKKVILVIRDGWGYRKSKDHNAIANTSTPNTDKLMKKYPNTLLQASGEPVGLPKGFEGNSEVGHMTIGSGRNAKQSLARINHAIRDGSFFKKKEFLNAINNCKKHGTKLHLVGLVQTEGVHSHIAHLFALLDLCKKKNFTDVLVHVITDGRDAPVTESRKHVKDLLKKLDLLGFGKVATINGRYFAMDRDKRWDRTKKAYNAIILGKSEKKPFMDIRVQLINCHKNHEYDEFIVPRVANWYKGVKPHDSIIFYNFRTDRPRQFTKAVVEKNFIGWKRKPINIFYVGMMDYYRPMSAHYAFEELVLKRLLGEVISENGFKQFRISETEKYAHITFFFNGQIEKPFKCEDRLLIHSPNVATYDQSPDMSIYKISKELVKAIKTEKYDFLVTNLVNGDMVGHTGIVPAIKKAVKAVDDVLGKVVEAGLEHDYSILVCADHGNAEDQTKAWRTSHTTNPVPFVLISNDAKLQKCKLKKGGLSDIAPTTLKLLGLKKPKEMTGKSLI
ncbi:2,3-bisphosphoglycerate-independent phosphoglycerate mutase [archaeon]|nr:2,3-bisphosphoglycerate-independent phosphoglycerate mutase [archaeon]MBL7057619.1 2,3-bisphosphoglycerate-independent phosphoglycerate mutase [Candidatus Woesearchaeota archaeon]